jgi:hypothetical protein
MTHTHTHLSYINSNFYLVIFYKFGLFWKNEVISLSTWNTGNLHFCDILRTYKQMFQCINSKNTQYRTEISIAKALRAENFRALCLEHSVRFLRSYT